jgi:hypothetical protein
MLVVACTTVAPIAEFEAARDGAVWPVAVPAVMSRQARAREFEDRNRCIGPLRCRTAILLLSGLSSLCTQVCYAASKNFLHFENLRFGATPECRSQQCLRLGDLNTPNDGSITGGRGDRFCGCLARVVYATQQHFRGGSIEPYGAHIALNR